MTATYYAGVQVHVKSDAGEDLHWSAYRYDFGFQHGDEWSGSLYGKLHFPKAIVEVEGSREDVLAMVAQGPAGVPRPPEGWLASLDALTAAPDRIAQASVALDAATIARVNGGRRQF